MLAYELVGVRVSLRTSWCAYDLVCVRVCACTSLCVYELVRTSLRAYELTSIHHLGDSA